MHVDQGFWQWPYSPQGTRSLHKSPSVHNPLVPIPGSASSCSCANNGMVFKLAAFFVKNCSTDHLRFNFLYHRFWFIFHWGVLERQRTICQTDFLFSFFAFISFPIEMKWIFRRLTGWRGSMEETCKLPRVIFFWGLLVLLLREIICKRDKKGLDAHLERTLKALIQQQHPFEPVQCPNSWFIVAQWYLTLWNAMTLQCHV